MHDKVRKITHQNEKKSRKYANTVYKWLIKNGRYFVAPQSETDNLKVLFARLAAAGVGRPVDDNGFSDGPWTPDTLADAISAIEANSEGIELRAVQMWFQDNQSGISKSNIRWLARIFGCDDPDAVSQWQAELLAARDRLTKERREARKRTAPSPSLADQISLDVKKCAKQSNGSPALAVKMDVPKKDLAPSARSNGSPLGRTASKDIAKRTHAMFASESSLTLPLLVFTGACALILIAFSLNLHSITYAPTDGPSKQVGFVWAPNWTIVFIAFLPLYVSSLMELMRLWQKDLRPNLLKFCTNSRTIPTWEDLLEQSKYSFWLTFIVTVLVASGYNWIATHLRPLLEGDPGSWPINWSRIAIFKPEHVSVRASIAFSGLVFFYNAFTAYVFFSGLVILHLIKSDLVRIADSVDPAHASSSAMRVHMTGDGIMKHVFRCTALGLAITMMMKLQSSYLQSDAENIVVWLLQDMMAIIGLHGQTEAFIEPRGAAPGLIYSFLCVIAIAGTFIVVQAGIRSALRRVACSGLTGCATPWTSMNICMTLLVFSYLSIGFIPGFSAMVLLSLLVAGYVTIKPNEIVKEASA